MVDVQMPEASAVIPSDRPGQGTLPAMFSRGVFDPEIAKRCNADPAKALVMSYVCLLVANGCAEWDLLDNGDIQLSFNTGETFLLAEKVIIRLA